MSSWLIFQPRNTTTVKINWTVACLTTRLKVINTFLLTKTFCNQLSLIAFNATINTTLDLVHPMATNTFIEWWKETTNQVLLEHNTWISTFIASRQSSYLSALEIISGSWAGLKTTWYLWLSEEDEEVVRLVVFGSQGWRTIWCQQTIDNEVGRALMMLQQIKGEVNNQI